MLSAVRAGAWCAPIILSLASILSAAEIHDQTSLPHFRSRVDLVSVSFTVADASGHYLESLSPEDIRIYEDGVEQQINSFASPDLVKTSQLPVENSVFVLLDTGDAMYDDFIKVNEIVTGFVREISPGHGVAVYTFSRNLYRSSPLSRNEFQRISAARSPILGDQSAVFNALLLTLRDAARAPGNKTVVVLSNGPDTASVVSPDDVARVAREEGIPIHIVFTEATDEPLQAALRRVSASTGGESHYSMRWGMQRAALRRIRDEIMSAFTVTYYPLPNENDGFRRIEIEIKSDPGKRYRVRARPGYKPSNQPAETCINCSFAGVTERVTSAP